MAACHPMKPAMCSAPILARWLKRTLPGVRHYLGMSTATFESTAVGNCIKSAMLPEFQAQKNKKTHFLIMSPKKLKELLIGEKLQNTYL